MRYLLTGGGTGGHIYPALAIADALKELDPGAELLYVGTEAGRESGVVPRAGIPFTVISSGGLVNLSARQKLAGGLRALKGVLDSARHIRRFRPDVVIGTGGFVSGPVMLAAWLLGRPLVIQEQNAFPGVTNRVAARWAQTVFVPYDEARPYFPKGTAIRRVGNPIRREVGAATRAEGRRAFGYSKADRVLLVTGGSGGARDLHNAVVAAVERLEAAEPGSLKVLHVSGERYFEQVRQAYGGRPGVTVLPYVHNMPEAYAAADAGVFRAGAITLAEIQVRGLPSVLIPSPNVTHNHQEWNARTLESRGAALVVRERELSPQRLADAIRTAMGEPGAAMRAALLELAEPDAARTIAGEIIAIARKR